MGQNKENITLHTLDRPNSWGRGMAHAHGNTGTHLHVFRGLWDALFTHTIQWRAQTPDSHAHTCTLVLWLQSQTNDALSNQSSLPIRPLSQWTSLVSKFKCVNRNTYGLQRPITICTTCSDSQWEWEQLTEVEKVPSSATIWRYYIKHFPKNKSSFELPCSSSLTVTDLSESTALSSGFSWMLLCQVSGRYLLWIIIIRLNNIKCWVNAKYWIQNNTMLLSIFSVFSFQWSWKNVTVNRVIHVHAQVFCDQTFVCVWQS